MKFLSSCKYFYNEYLGFGEELFGNSTTAFCPCRLFSLVIGQEKHTDYGGHRLCSYLRVCLEVVFLEAELEVRTQVVRFLESPMRKELKSAWTWDRAEQSLEHQFQMVHWALNSRGSHDLSQLEARGQALYPLIKQPCS